MAKFKVILERIDTITKQAEIIVEAASAEEAQRRVAETTVGAPPAPWRKRRPADDLR